MARNPIKGPGKFEGETYIARYVHEEPDEDIGSVDELGWYGRFSGKIKGRGPFHLYVFEGSQGFVTASFFDTKAELDDAWDEIEAAYSNYYDEGDEGDE
jgi:hypothetical protein